MQPDGYLLTWYRINAFKATVIFRGLFAQVEFISENFWQFSFYLQNEKNQNAFCSHVNPKHMFLYFKTLSYKYASNHIYGVLIN